jgi:hypothetical protein
MTPMKAVTSISKVYEIDNNNIIMIVYDILKTYDYGHYSTQMSSRRK